MKKGGLLEMLKRFRLNFLRNKKKKTLLLKIMVVVVYPFRLFFNQMRSDKKTQKEIEIDGLDINSNIQDKKILKQIENIQKRVELPNVSIKDIKKEIAQVEEQIKKVDNSSKQIYNKKIMIINKTLEERNNQRLTSDKRGLESENIVDKEMKKENEFKTHVKKDIEDSTVLVNQSTVGRNLFSQELNSKTDKKYEPDNKLKEINEKLIVIEEKINTNYYNDLYECENKLKNIELEIENIKVQFEKYNLPFDYNFEGLSLEKIEEKLSDAKKKINQRKDQLYHSVQSETKNNNLKENVKEDLKKENNKINTINDKANEFIIDSIKRQNKLLEEYDKKRNNKNIFYYLNSLSRDIFLVFTFGIFKNSLFNTLVSSIMINNSFKNMKKLITKKKINYEILDCQIYSNQKMILEINRINNDSLNELLSIKENMLYLYQNNLDNVELKHFLSEIGKMENKIESVNRQLDNYDFSLKKARQKVKMIY